jgi:hypothetical protein
VVEITLSPRSSKAIDNSFPIPDLGRARNQQPLEPWKREGKRSVRSSGDEPNKLFGHSSVEGMLVRFSEV